MTFEATVFALAMVIGLLLAETRLSMRNETSLRARGAIEAPGDIYVAMSILYPLAFLLMGAEGIWRSRIPAAVAPGAPSSPTWWAAGVLLMLASKGLKYWAIANLGNRWTFKVLVLPGVALVRTGPYRYVDHPNYIAVIGELTAMTLMMSAWIVGPILTLVFGAALLMRLRVETRALRDQRTR
ncbi:MAG: isoprenylcysteine carboxylmethyltransferase family protein [Vicinamibacterales bacterium]